MQQLGKSKLFIFSMSMLSAACTYAATPIDVSTQPYNFLQQLSITSPDTTMQPLSQRTDFNHTKHVRLQQHYQGVPVFGADIVAHIPQNTLKADAATMNGTVYGDLKKDLQSTPAYALEAAQANRALTHSQALYGNVKGQVDLQDGQVKKIIYLDKNNKAHWAYQVSFFANKPGLPEKPIYILDATSFEVLANWNNLQTETTQDGGGFGGNLKMGKLVYDGKKDDYASLQMARDEGKKTCFLHNDDVVVKDRSKSDAIVKFDCDKVDKSHNGIYWDADFDAVNGGYSPSNDALYAGKVIKEMYTQWYDVPVLEKDGKPMLLVMRVHEYMDNAYWDGRQMTFGDGVSDFYPLTSLGVAAHEISHGFTEQHSNLVYNNQSGGLNESFSDMAAQAAEYYSIQKNSWQIGPEIFKAKDEALRYMDHPSKDCGAGRTPGNWCSIENVKDYNDNIDVHYSSGVFNRLFYLMGSAKGWNARKAFDVMVQANMNYWTSTTSFQAAACGVLKATKDLKYPVAAVNKAIKAVGLMTKCSK